MAKKDRKLKRQKKRSAIQKKTTNQLAYEKQIKRLKQGVKYYESKGYKILTDVIPERPKRITKNTLAQLSKIKPKDLIKNAELVNVETGEILTGKERSKRLASERKEKQRQARERQKVSRETYYPKIDIIDKIKELIENVPNVVAYYDQNSRTWNTRNRGTQMANILMSTLDDNLMATESSSDEEYYKYLEYLDSNYSYLQVELDTTIRDSNGETVERAFNNSIRILNNGDNVSFSSASQLNDMSDYFY